MLDLYQPNDYLITMGDVGFGRSVDIVLDGNSFPAIDVNFKVYNISTKEYIDFGFVELDLEGGEGVLSSKDSKKDRICFLEPDKDDSLVYTWWFYLDGNVDGTRLPTVGDTASVFLRKPFLSTDVYRFVASQSKIEKELAKSDLKNIKVVPNPYYASAKWETKNPYSSGRGSRSIHFTHLPAECTIRIFTINGELVQTIYHNEQFSNGTADWNMLSRDNLGISYGIYIYHVEAPGVGEKVGKFAIIK